METLEGEENIEDDEIADENHNIHRYVSERVPS